VLHAGVKQKLKETLAAFSVPLEMTDAEVLTELTPAELSPAAGLKAELLADVNELRTELQVERGRYRYRYV